MLIFISLQGFDILPKYQFFKFLLAPNSILPNLIILGSENKDIILDITIFDIQRILQVISHKISNFF
jgi:hypothetical protein